MVDQHPLAALIFKRKIPFEDWLITSNTNFNPLQGAAMVPNFDWTNSALGPVSTWPGPLIEAVDRVLSSSQPALVAWGEELIQIYNPAFIPVLRDRHPRGMGQPMAICWHDIWGFFGPIYQSVLRTGIDVKLDDIAVPIVSGDIVEVRNFSIRYSAIRLPDRSVGGVIVFATETTDQHLIKSLAQSNPPGL